MRCWFPSLVTTSASSIRLLKRAYSASGRQPPEAQRRQISRGVGTMDLPLEGKLKVGVNTMHRRTEPAVGPWQPSIDELVAMVRQVDDLGYDSCWCGDPISMAIPFLNPFLQTPNAPVATTGRAPRREKGV